MTNTHDYILEIEHVTKEFPGVRALNDISFIINHTTNAIIKAFIVPITIKRNIRTDSFTPTLCFTL